MELRMKPLLFPAHHEAIYPCCPAHRVAMLQDPLRQIMDPATSGYAGRAGKQWVAMDSPVKPANDRIED